MCLVDHITQVCRCIWKCLHCRRPPSPDPYDCSGSSSGQGKGLLIGRMPLLRPWAWTLIPDKSCSVVSCLNCEVHCITASAKWVKRSHDHTIKLPLLHLLSLHYWQQKAQLWRAGFDFCAQKKGMMQLSPCFDYRGLNQVRVKYWYVLT